MIQIDNRMITDMKHKYMNDLPSPISGNILLGRKWGFLAELHITVQCSFLKLPEYYVFEHKPHTLLNSEILS